MYTPHSIPCALLLLLSLTACQQEVLTEEKRPALPQEAPISFTRGMVDNVSRVGNGLEEYATTMGVWGWRKQDGEKEQVFRHQRVYYDPAEQGWFYSPLKYWNTRSTYDFYAYAPYEPSLVTIEDGKWIHIVGVSVAGENVQETPHAQEVKVFSQDTDWMVARAGQTDVPGTYGATVQFCMQHVLSKLNVRIRTSQEMADATTSVTLDELTIGTFAASGSFAQQLLHTPVTAAERAVEEWTLAPGAQGLTLGRTTRCTIPTSYSYVLESLLRIADGLYAPLCRRPRGDLPLQPAPARGQCGLRDTGERVQLHPLLHHRPEQHPVPGQCLSVGRRRDGRFGVTINDN